MGKSFGIVDIMLVPFAIRFDQILGEFRNFSVPSDDCFERYHLWYKAVREVEAVKGTVQSREKLVDAYRRYADDTAKTEVADAIRGGKALP